MALMAARRRAKEKVTTGGMFIGSSLSHRHHELTSIGASLSRWG
jgi:hypothetical protein